MRAAFVLFFSLVALAGRVMALTITVAGTNFTADQFLLVNDTQLNNDCQQRCAPGITAIQNCDDNDTCLCDVTATIPPVRDCQQCYYESVIAANRKMPFVNAGSTPALAAYVAACKAPPTNITVPPTAVALTLAPNWDGPVGIGLSTGATVVYLISVLAIGVSLITILCTM